MFVSDRATNAPVDIFHFNEGFLCEELCVPLTKTNRHWERGALDLVVGPLGGSCIWPRRTLHWAKFNQTRRWWAKAAELTDCPSWSRGLEDLENDCHSWKAFTIRGRHQRLCWCRWFFLITLQPLLHEQTLLMVTSASVTFSRCLRYQENTLSCERFTPTTPPCLRPQPTTCPSGPFKHNLTTHFFFLNRCEIEYLSKLHSCKLPNNVWDPSLAHSAGAQQRGEEKQKGH